MTSYVCKIQSIKEWMGVFQATNNLYHTKIGCNILTLAITMWYLMITCRRHVYCFFLCVNEDWEYLGASYFKIKAIFFVGKLFWVIIFTFLSLPLAPIFHIKLSVAKPDNLHISHLSLSNLHYTHRRVLDLI